MGNKTLEGYPGNRFHGGGEYVDVVESLAIERAKELFGAAYANVQPHSGITSNKNPVPFDARSPSTWTGLRLGVSAATTRGFGIAEMEMLGECMAQLLKAEAVAEPAALEQIKPRLARLTGGGLPSAQQTGKLRKTPVNAKPGTDRVIDAFMSMDHYERDRTFRHVMADGDCKRARLPRRSETVPRRERHPPERAILVQGPQCSLHPRPRPKRDRAGHVHRKRARNQDHRRSELLPNAAVNEAFTPDPRTRKMLCVTSTLHPPLARLS